MRIGINCLSVDPEYVGGVNTYVLGLLGGFAAVGGPHRFRLFVSSRNAKLFAPFAELPGFEVELVPGASARARRILPKLAEFTGSPQGFRHATDLAYHDVARRMERGCDLLYTPTTTLLPFASRRPQLLSMHDIQHMHYPEFFSHAERRQRALTFAGSVKAASWFQASSVFIQEDLLAHFPGIRPEQIVVIPEGVAVDRFREVAPGTSVRTRYGLPERFLFYPAQLWPHKNHLTVLRALAQVRDETGRELPLVLTGAAYGAAPEIFAYITAQRLGEVRYLGKVPFGDMVGLYQASWFTMAAGLYESSSLCLLEGAAAGAPLLASSIPPNVEMNRLLDIHLFAPLDHRALAADLLRLWDDEALRERQRRVNSVAVDHYSWEKIAQRYLDFIDRVMPTRGA